MEGLFPQTSPISFGEFIMLTSARKWKVWATSVVVGVLVCFVGPTLSWADNLGGWVTLEESSVKICTFAPMSLICFLTKNL